MTEEEQTQEEHEMMPTAPYTAKLRSGRHVLMQDLNPKMLKRLSYKALRNLKKAIYELAAHKAELDRRGYDHEDLKSFIPFKEFNMWQMVTHATLISLNNYNTHYPSTPVVWDERPKKGDEEE